MNAAEEAVAKFLLDHLGATVTLVALSVSVKLANFLAKKWPIPPASAPWWKRAAHFLLVNWPQWGDELEGEVKGLQTSTRAMPFVSWTKRVDANPVEAAREVLHEPAKPEEPKINNGGYIHVGIMLCIGAIGFVLVLVFGCGCDGFKAPAYETLTVVVKSADAARAELPEACKLVEVHAVEAAKTKAEANDKTSAIHGRCEAALTGLEAVGKSAKVARDGIYDGSELAKDPKSFLSWAKAAVDLYKNLGPLLAEFSVMLPKIQGVN